MTQNGAPGQLLDPRRVAERSKNLQKPIENRCFCDVHKIAHEGLRDALFVPRGLQMSPQLAKRWAKVPKRSPFWTHFPFFVRSISALDARWGPEGCPDALRHTKMIKIYRKSTLGHQNRLQKRPKVHENHSQNEQSKR